MTLLFVTNAQVDHRLDWRPAGNNGAIRTVKRWVVLPIADLAWRLMVWRNVLAHSKGAKCVIRSTSAEFAVTGGAAKFFSTCRGRGAY
jgi:hypothetical protein